MPLPQAPEARTFYQSAKQRFEDAAFLLAVGRTTGAVYLAGYGVECMLKALIVVNIPPAGREEALASFRGGRAHDYDWLKAQYFRRGGARFPSAVSRDFALVNSWTTDMRYTAGSMKLGEAETFLDAARAIMVWAEGRF